MALVLVAVCASAASADTRGNQIAYDYALRCFVAGAVLQGDKKGSASPDEKAAIDQHTRRSYDMAFKLGAALGYAKTQISADLDSYQRSEVRHMTVDDSYFRATQADCAKLGLM